MTITNYTTTWHNRDNVTLCVINDDNVPTIVGTCMLDFCGDNKKECYLWNLHVSEDHREHGLAKALIEEATNIAKERGCASIEIEWDKRDSPYWVLDWYTRLGFDEKEFGSNSELLSKKI